MTLPPVLMELSLRQRGAFSRVQALSCGVPPTCVDFWVTSGALVVLRRGVYAPREVAEAATSRQAAHQLAVQAAVLRLMGELFVSHESAAIEYGLFVLDHPADVHLTRPSADLRSHDQYERLYVHRAQLPDHHRNGGLIVPTVSVARAVVDTARRSGLLAGVVAADSALNRRLCTVEDLQQAAQDLAGWPNFTDVETAVALADGRSQAPGESVSRVRFRETDLPQPVPQSPIYWRGELAGYGDLEWKDEGVVGEIDGGEKYRADPWLSIRKERQRQEKIELAGRIVVRWTHDEAVHEFHERVVPRVRRGFAKARALRSA